MTTKQVPDILKNLEGIFVGMLTDEEGKAFDIACRDGLCYRRYQSAAGFMGLAKVGMIASGDERCANCPNPDEDGCPPGA